MSESDVLYNPLLAFIASNRSVAATAHIKTVCLARFTPDQIQLAKNSLWDLASAASVLGENPKLVLHLKHTWWTSLKVFINWITLINSQELLCLLRISTPYPGSELKILT
jgi:hypothetical protein